MTRIKRGGRELTVDDSVVAEYLKEGYSVIDDHGNEITRGAAQNLSQAQRELAAERQRTTTLAAALDDAYRHIAELEDENKRLSAEIASMQADAEQPEEQKASRKASAKK